MYFARGIKANLPCAASMAEKYGIYPCEIRTIISKSPRHSLMLIYYISKLNQCLASDFQNETIISFLRVILKSRKKYFRVPPVDSSVLFRAFGRNGFWFFPVPCCVKADGRKP
jgi:hypothetical protein